MADSELCLLDQDISSISQVPLDAGVTSLNLHCNRVSHIDGLATARHLRHLDLSSNRISRIAGLEALSSLRTLNLSCNSISRVEGFLYLHGSEYKLKHVHLQCNQLDNMNHVLQCMLGLQSLRDVTLGADGAHNPVCALPAYRELVLQSLPQISILDAVDRWGNPAPQGQDGPTDIPGLEDFLELLLSSDASVGADRMESDAPPRINKVPTPVREKSCSGRKTGTPERPQPGQLASLSRNHSNKLNRKKVEQQASRDLLMVPISFPPVNARSSSRPQADGADTSTVTSPSCPTPRKAKRDTDLTSESDWDSGKENRRSRVHGRLKSPGKKAAEAGGARSSHSDGAAQKRRSAKPLTEFRKKTSVQPKPSLKAAGDEAQEETYRAIVEERDQERERRWKAEQAVRRLTDGMKSLQARVSEEKDLQSMALHTTDRLKEVLLKERSERLRLQTRVQELEERCSVCAEQLEQARGREDQHKRALRSLEDSASQRESTRALQQAEQMKRTQELENRAAALKREVEILRASDRQRAEKHSQLQELLVSREQDHRKELERRPLPGGAEFREAVAREAELLEQRSAEKEAAAQEKLAEARQRYAALEDEFREALVVEAARFSEVKAGFDRAAAELTRARQSASLVQELTAMVKEQKSRIDELVRAKRSTVAGLRARVRSLEVRAEDDRKLDLQVELLKKDKSRLLSQVTAQESIIDGLRGERKLWGQELARQGASLAQDRGRLESRVEILTAELETQKKQNERDIDTLRIKAKIVEDQTETIRKLKEALLERDERIRRQEEERQQAERHFQLRLQEETAPLAGLPQRVQQLQQQLEDKEAELDELRDTYRASSKKWQDKANLLTVLESQVRSMKEGFDQKEKSLQEERDRASHAHRAAVEKLHSADDAFRRQLESLQASHRAQLLRVASDKQKQTEAASRKVAQVEEEMRQLLEETEFNKRTMEDKMRRLASMLKDF
ncbi:leucine-rich repeat and coiled-coil domain-containing protein 1 isoform X2 [Denticeps clupeoides]|uniref:leucine-rich repeat and coiled-coil domain-containing protein 1 isoform X2 n=1 Tax=Denticeps clupeoides TaxID=299321 RepID=UPI0010A33287|nr:leucine-rich repeat and coiled-coil domain-containing protein 1 isoform X2 [Denticeps clupeoides]